MRIQEKGLVTWLIDSALVFNNNYVQDPASLYYTSCAIQADSRESLIRMIMPFWNGNLDTPCLELTLYCGCRGSWKTLDDIPMKSVYCPHENFLIKYNIG